MGDPKICKNGHKYYKTSDCPVCPICEKKKSSTDALAGNNQKFLMLLGAPARRALENNGISTLEKLSKRSEREILSFHGIGPSSIPILKKCLKEAGLRFKI